MIVFLILAGDQEQWTGQLLADTALLLTSDTQGIKTVSYIEKLVLSLFFLLIALNLRISGVCRSSLRSANSGGQNSSLSRLADGFP